MKTRTKSSGYEVESPYATNQTFFKDGSPNAFYDYAAGSRSSTVHSEVICYEIGKDDKRTKFCDHRVITDRWYPFSGVRYSPTGTFGVMSNYVYDSAGLHSLVSPGWTGNTVDPDFNRRAFQAMLPDLEQGLNLGVMIAELTDIKFLLNLVWNWKGFIRKGAEGHLSYQFGIKPLISDCKKLYKNLTNHSDILIDFLGRRKKLQKRYYSEAEIVDSGDSGWVAQNASTEVRLKWSESYVVTATMTYRYDCQGIDSYIDFCNAMRQMLGLRLSMATIWELIPFSFLLDWIFRIGDFLEQYEKDAFPTTCTVEEFTISEKVVREYTTYLHHYTGYNPMEWTATPIRKYQEKTYKRRRTVPDSDNTFINRGQYGLNQLALSTSLLITRKR